MLLFSSTQIQFRVMSSTAIHAHIHMYSNLKL